MARPIKHNPEEVLVQTMNLFWKKGYESTSIQDIVAVTGLKPGSLYNIFGSKEGIFEAVLALYSNNNIQAVKEILEQGDDYLLNIEKFLNEIVVNSIANEQTNGCLLVKTLLVVSHKDKKIQAQIVKVFKEIEGLLKEALQKAKDKGETLVNPSSFAKFIISNIYGAHVYYKANKKEEVLHENVRFLMESLSL